MCIRLKQRKHTEIQPIENLSETESMVNIDLRRIDSRAYYYRLIALPISLLVGNGGHSEGYIEYARHFGQYKRQKQVKRTCLFSVTRRVAKFYANGIFHMVFLPTMYGTLFLFLLST